MIARRAAPLLLARAVPGGVSLALAALSLAACVGPRRAEPAWERAYSRTMRQYVDPVPGVSLEVPREFAFTRIDDTRAEWVTASAGDEPALRARMRRYRLPCNDIAAADASGAAAGAPRGGRLLEQLRVPKDGSAVLLDTTRGRADGGQRRWLMRTVAPCRIVDLEFSGPVDAFERNRAQLEAIVRSLRLTGEAQEADEESLLESRPAVTRPTGKGAKTKASTGKQEKRSGGPLEGRAGKDVDGERLSREQPLGAESIEEELRGEDATDEESIDRPEIDSEEGP